MSESILILCLIITFVTCKEKSNDKIYETEMPASEIPLAVTKNEMTEKTNYYFIRIVVSQLIWTTV